MPALFGRMKKYESAVCPGLITTAFVGLGKVGKRGNPQIKLQPSSASSWTSLPAQIHKRAGISCINVLSVLDVCLSPDSAVPWMAWGGINAVVVQTSYI